MIEAVGEALSLTVSKVSLLYFTGHESINEFRLAMSEGNKRLIGIRHFNINVCSEIYITSY